MTALTMPRSLRRGATVPSTAARQTGDAGAPVARGGFRAPRVDERSSVAPAAGENSRASAPAAVRLTRQGRLLLIGLPFVTGAAALLVVAAVFLLPATVKASTDAVEEPVTRSVTVQADQTLWEIAAATDPQRDPREVMSDIAELNELASPTLTSGQVLEVPTR